MKLGFVILIFTFKASFIGKAVLFFLKKPSPVTNVTGCRTEIHRTKKNQDGTQERDYQTSEKGMQERREGCLFFFFLIYVTCLTNNWSPIKIKYMVRIITIKLYDLDLSDNHTYQKRKKVRVP